MMDAVNCGENKGCVTFPCSPPSNDICATVTWQRATNQTSRLINFELSGKTDGWVAIAFSRDKLMVKIIIKCKN